MFPWLEDLSRVPHFIGYHTRYDSPIWGTLTLNAWKVYSDIPQINGFQLNSPLYRILLLSYKPQFGEYWTFFKLKQSHERLHWCKRVLCSTNKLGNPARKFPSFLDFILLIWLGCSPNCWNSNKFPTLLDICHNIKQQYGELRRLQLERNK